MSGGSAVTTYGIPIDEITRQAREVSPARTILTWIGAVLFALGWVLHKTFMVLWLAGAWAFVAIREGWREAGRTRVSRGTG
jgi:hypothetical protein